MQEWKAKINGFFQPKSQAERQKMMKYVIVMPAAILCGIVILWLLYSSLNGDEPKTGNAFNTEIPDGENDGIIIVQTRNRVIHSYEKVENEFLWGLVKLHIPQLKEDVEQILAEHESRDNRDNRAD